jgi:hypothetical protein
MTTMISCASISLRYMSINMTHTCTPMILCPLIKIISNIIYFNCACATLICLNQNKQNGSHNTPLKELGRDQFNPLQVLLQRIQIKYTSLIGLVMLLQLCIDQLSSTNNICSRSFDSLCFVYSQSVFLKIVKPLD